MKKQAIAVAVAAAVTASAGAYAHSDTTAYAKFNYSWNEGEDKSDNHSTVTFGFANKGDWYDHTFNVDLEHFENSGVDEVNPMSDDSYTSTNYRFRFDPFELLAGERLTFGPLTRVLWATKGNWATLSDGDQRKRLEIGPTFQFAAPFTSGVNLDVWYRDTLNVPGDAMHYTVSTGVPFELAHQALSFDVTYELVTNENVNQSDVFESEYAINWAINDHLTAGFSVNTVDNRDAKVVGGYRYNDYHQTEITYKF